MNALLAALLVMLAAAGVLVVVAGLQPAPDQSERMPSSLQIRIRELRSHFTRRRQLIAAGGLVVGIVLWSVSGWIILLVAAPVAAIGIPILLGRGNERELLERLDAIETWTRSLAGLTNAGASLEQTIQASVSSVSAAIRPNVEVLVYRLNARWSTSAALQAFADELHDSTADLVVTHLLLAEKVRGPGLANALEDLAEIIFEEASVRRQIETDRAKPRQNVRIITIITVVLLGLVPFAGTFMAPYRTVLGQLVLAVWLLIYVAVLIWLKRITRGRSTPRLLENPRARKVDA